MSEWRDWELQQFMAFDPPTPPPAGGEAVRLAMEDLASNDRKIRTWRRAGYTGGARFRRGDTLVARITPCLDTVRHAGSTPRASGAYRLLCGQLPARTCYLGSSVRPRR